MQLVKNNIGFKSEYRIAPVLPSDQAALNALLGDVTIVKGKSSTKVHHLSWGGDGIARFNFQYCAAEIDSVVDWFDCEEIVISFTFEIDQNGLPLPVWHCGGYGFVDGIVNLDRVAINA